MMRRARALSVLLSAGLVLSGAGIDVSIKTNDVASTTWQSNASAPFPGEYADARTRPDE